jgi:DNA-binding transcriptional MerR regulator
MTNFIFYHNPTVTIVCLPAGAPVFHSLEAAARLCGVHPDLLRHYCRLGLLGPDRLDPASDPVFDDNALYELRRIEHYRHHHGVNRLALPHLCALWRELESLQAEIRFLRGS